MYIQSYTTHAKYKQTNNQFKNTAMSISLDELIIHKYNIPINTLRIHRPKRIRTCTLNHIHKSRRTKNDHGEIGQNRGSVRTSTDTTIVFFANRA